jgi:hypothetical protein
MCLPFNDVSHDARFLLLLRLTAHVLENLVHLFQTLSCSLWNDEVREDESEQAEDGEERVSSEAGILDERRGDEALMYVNSWSSRLDRCRANLQ